LEAVDRRFEAASEGDRILDRRAGFMEGSRDCREVELVRGSADESGDVRVSSTAGGEAAIAVLVLLFDETALAMGQCGLVMDG
jgi:hypothetical protein